MDELAAGATLGHYRLVGRLGSGAMGDVWSAWLAGPRGFRKPVALKVLRSERVTEARRDALVREAKLGALLQHQNIVGVYALEQIEGRWVVVMERVDGAALGTLLVRALSPRAVVDLGLQACAGLTHLHGLSVGGRPMGLVHRDVKPGNLLIDRSGTVKLADLGVAFARGDSSDAVGTPGYMPIEQIEGRPEPRSDLFGLGVCLVVAATLVRPFGQGPAALAAVLDPRSVRLEAAVRVTDRELPGLGEIVRGCLAPDPADRWSSAADLGDALAALRLDATGPSLLEVLASERPDLAIRSGPSRSSMDPTRRLARVGNLPARWDGFFGREAEVAQVLGALADPDALVVLVGPGGMGKTRLALEVARRRPVADPRDRVWFFDLSEARTPEAVCIGVARALGVPVHATSVTDQVAQLDQALHARGAELLVFDNLEQCVDAVPQTIGTWRERVGCPILCTSRIALPLSGATKVRLQPLDTTAAVEMFMARAPLAIDDADRPHVAALVDAVDRMPLAVELAAARAGMLPLDQLRERLGLRMLAGGGDERPARHRSVSAAIEGSWGLLSDLERDALARLSVFEGGFDLRAAEAVLDLPAGDGWALDVLHALVDASLVAVDPAAGRFSLLAVVQQFARGRLPDRVAVEARHGAWFGQAGSQPDPRDIDNLVAAIGRAVARGDGAVAVGCALSAVEVLERHGPLVAAIPLLEQVLDVASAPERSLVLASLAHARSVVRAGGDLVLAQQLLAEATHGGEPAALARAHYAVAVAMRTRGDEAALEHSVQAQVLWRRVGDRRGLAKALSQAANLHGDRGQNPQAIALDRQAIELLRQDRDLAGAAIVLTNLCNKLRAAGRTDEALATVDEAIALHGAIGHRRSLSVALRHRGVLQGQVGDLRGGVVSIGRALDVARKAGDMASALLAAVCLADLHNTLGDGERARAYTDEAARAHEAIPLPRFLHAIALQRARLHRATGDLTAAERTVASVPMARTDGVGDAMAVWGALLRADLALDRQRPGEAARLLGSLDPDRVGLRYKPVRLALKVVDARRQVAAATSGAADAVEVAHQMCLDARHGSLLVQVLLMRADLERAEGRGAAAAASLSAARRGALWMDLEPGGWLASQIRLREQAGAGTSPPTGA